VTATEVDGSTSNEGVIGVGAGIATSSVITSNSVGANGVTINVGGINTITETVSGNGGQITITGTEVDGSTTNELQTYSHAGTSTYTNTLSNGGGTWSLTGGGIAVVSQTGGAVTVTANIVTNSTLSGAGTSGSPLLISQNGATNGQSLVWNGSNWVPEFSYGNFGQLSNWITYENANTIPPGWSPVFASNAATSNTPGISGWHILRVYGGGNSSGFEYNIGTSFFGGPLWYRHKIGGNNEVWRRLDGNFGVYDIENLSSTFSGNPSLGWNVVGSYAGTPSDGPQGSPQYYHLSLQGGRDQPGSKMWIAIPRPTNAGVDKNYIWINGVDGNGWSKSKSGFSDLAGNITLSASNGQILRHNGTTWISSNETTGGVIGVGAGIATSSVITSNSAGSNGVTINVGGINTITETVSSNGGQI
ncbi:MAG: hypothetical protein ACRCZ9_00830, partial [Fusobacteriaceae bacterium]